VPLLAGQLLEEGLALVDLGRCTEQWLY
jgi:hypothetical protein